MGRLRDERGEMEEERRIGEPSLFDTLYKKIVPTSLAWLT